MLINRVGFRGYVRHYFETFFRLYSSVKKHCDFLAASIVGNSRVAVPHTKACERYTEQDG